MGWGGGEVMCGKMCIGTSWDICTHAKAEKGKASEKFLQKSCTSAECAGARLGLNSSYSDVLCGRDNSTPVPHK